MTALLRGVPIKTALAANASVTYSLPSSLDGHGIDVAASAQDLAAETKLEVFASPDDEHFAIVGESTEASDFTVNIRSLTARYIKVVVSVACNVRVLIA